MEHHGDVDYSYYSYCRKSTGREFFVPARTLIAVKLLVVGNIILIPRLNRHDV